MRTWRQTNALGGVLLVVVAVAFVLVIMSVVTAYGPVDACHSEGERMGGAYTIHVWSENGRDACSVEPLDVNPWEG